MGFISQCHFEDVHFLSVSVNGGTSFMGSFPDEMKYPRSGIHVSRIRETKKCQFYFLVFSLKELSTFVRVL